MKQDTKDLLYWACSYCAMENKSSEFALQYLQDAAGVDHDTAIEFILAFNEEEFVKWYENGGEERAIKLIQQKIFTTQ